MSLRRTATLVSPPSVEPVTLADFKLFAKIDGDDEDASLSMFIQAARMAAENFTRRAFITQSWKLTLDSASYGWANDLPEGVYDLPVTALYGDIPSSVRLLRPPIISVVSVTTYDTANASSLYDPLNYVLDIAGARMVLTQTATWPSGQRQYGATEIITTNGYGPNPSDVPAPIRQAIMMEANKLYESRGLCDAELSGHAQQLLQQYRVMDHL